MDTQTAVRIPVDEFPILQHGHYANHAAIAPWPRAAAQAVANFGLENTELGPEKYAHWLLRETQLRQMLATMINAGSADDIALLKNTTDGICTVANGIDWRHGDNLLLPRDEFPSNRLPWLALQKLGVEVREVDIRAGAEPEQALLQHMDDRTRLLSVSAVQWTDGLRLQLETLGTACRQNNVLFFVDAIQQLGAIQMDVEACGIDFLAADGHKWMLAPEGIAVFYCHATVRERLKLSQHGWRMVDEPYKFTRENWQPSSTAIRFEAGSPNTLGQAAMHASIGLLQDIGMASVEALVRENSLVLSENLGSIPAIELVRPFEQHRVSGIVSFRVAGKDPAEVYRVLQQRNLTCAVRSEAIRLSPHFYQAGKPLQDILNIIEDVVSG
ncbi:MAG: aminotransferase class V-fold PLP-dependent enzyme [Gammaproteobacteria bacterium]|nr:MAG: aminotransferase class V-fold PLP-dependent enzyme [Gammaproteobacteria bacterium]